MSLPTSNDGTPPVLWRYDPSPAAALIFIAGFGLGTIAHFVQMCWLRTWYFIPFILGCILETFGYYGRYWSSQSPRDYGAYVMQLLLILPAPVFLAATMYMSIRRVIEALEANELSPMSPRWMSKLFVLGDVICFIIQVAGTGMQVTTSTDIQHIGGIVTVIGLIFQILVFALFVAMVWKFLCRCRLQERADIVSWKRYVVALLAASALIVLRNLVRGIEHAQGSESYISKHEAFAYIFEALFMLIVVVLFLIYQPGRLQRSLRLLKLSDNVEMQTAVGSQNEGLIPKADERRYQPYRASRAMHMRR